MNHYWLLCAVHSIYEKCSFITGTFKRMCKNLDWFCSMFMCICVCASVRLCVAWFIFLSLRLFFHLLNLLAAALMYTKQTLPVNVHEGARHLHHISGNICAGISAGALIVRVTWPQQCFWRACRTDMLRWELNYLIYCEVLPKMEGDGARQIFFSDCLPFIIYSTHAKTICIIEAIIVTWLKAFGVETHFNLVWQWWQHTLHCCVTS